MNKRKIFLVLAILFSVVPVTLFILLKPDLFIENQEDVKYPSYTSYPICEVRTIENEDFNLEELSKKDYIVFFPIDKIVYITPIRAYCNDADLVIIESIKNTPDNRPARCMLVRKGYPVQCDNTLRITGP